MRSIVLLLVLVGAATADVVLQRVIPNRIIYYPGQKGHVAVGLANRGEAPARGTLRLREFWDMTAGRALPDVPFELAAGETRTLAVPYQAGYHRYGHEIRCELVQDGQVTAAKSEFFNVVNEWWRVNIGVGYGGMPGQWQDRLFAWYDVPVPEKFEHTWYPSEQWLWYFPEVGPFMSYGSNCTRWLMQRSSVGKNFDHSLDPDERWYNITGMPRKIRDVLTDSRESHKRGVRHTMFTISNMEGTMGFELARRHPEYVLRNSRGGYEGYYMNPKTDPVRLADLDHGYNNWDYVTPNFCRRETLEWAVYDLLDGIKSYECDGVYFDGRYVTLSGYEYTGEKVEDKYDVPALAAEAMRYVRNQLKAVNPDYFLWTNGVHADRPDAEVSNDPDSGVLKEIQVAFITNPSFAMHSWRGLMDSLIQVRDQFWLAPPESPLRTNVIMNGYYGIHNWGGEKDQLIAPNREFTAFARHVISFVAANAMHPYGCGQPQYRSTLQVMTRFSEFYWHEDIRIMTDAYKRFNCDGLREVWWEDTVYTRDTSEYTDYYVHLVNTPDGDNAVLAIPDDPSPADDTEIATRLFQDPAKVQAWAIRPYSYDSTVLEPTVTPVTPGMVEGEMVFAVPEFTYYTLLVIRARK